MATVKQKMLAYQAVATLRNMQYRAHLIACNPNERQRVLMRHKLDAIHEDFKAYMRRNKREFDASVVGDTKGLFYGSL